MADICCYGVRYGKCEWGGRHVNEALLDSKLISIVFDLADIT